MADIITHTHTHTVIIRIPREEFKIIDHSLLSWLCVSGFLWFKHYELINWCGMEVMSPEEKINLVFNGNRLCGKLDHRPRGDDLMDVVVLENRRWIKRNVSMKKFCFIVWINDWFQDGWRQNNFLKSIDWQTTLRLHNESAGFKLTSSSVPGYVFYLLESTGFYQNNKPTTGLIRLWLSLVSSNIFVIPHYENYEQVYLKIIDIKIVYNVRKIS